MITISIRPDIFSKNNTYNVNVPYSKDATLYSYIKTALYDSEIISYLHEYFLKRNIIILLDKRSISPKLLKYIYPHDNSTIEIFFYPKAPFTAVSLTILLEELGLATAGWLAPTWMAIAANVLMYGSILGLGYLNFVLNKPSIPGFGSGSSDESTTYNWEGPQTSYAVGKPIPIIYGHHAYGGDYIGAYVRGASQGYESKYRDLGIKLPSSFSSNGTSSVKPTPGVDIASFKFDTFNLPMGGIQVRQIKFNVLLHEEIYAPKGRTYKETYDIYCHWRKLDNEGNPQEDWLDENKFSFIPEIRGHQKKITKDFEINFGGLGYYELWITAYNRTVNLWGCPIMNSCQYFGAAQKTDQTSQNALYKTELLTLNLGISDGEVAEIDTENILINNSPLENFYREAEGKTIYDSCILASRKGSLLPVPPEGNDIKDVLSKIGVSSADFQFLMEKGSFSPLANQFEYVTSGVVEAFEIIVKFPAGLFRYDDGKPKSSTVKFQIRYAAQQSDGSFGPWIDAYNNESKDFEISEFHLGEIIMTLSVGTTEQNQLSPGVYKIQLVRTSDVVRSNEEWNECYVVKVNEYIYETYYYPSTSTAMVQLTANERLSGNTPSFTIPIYGKYVRVPIVLRNSDQKIVPFQLCHTVYNEITGEYEVRETETNSLCTIQTSYDSTLFQYTNCPPFILYDILTNDMLKPYITESQLNWSEFIEAAKICWEYVDASVYGSSKEHRYELDLVIDTLTDLSQLINQIVASFRAKLFWVGNRIKLQVMKTEPITQILTSADIIPNSYQEQYQSNVPNTIDITYFNRDNNFKQETIQITKKDASYSQNEIISNNISFVGVTRLSQVLRLGSFYLNYAQLSNKIVTVSTTIASLASEPGDIIGIEHVTIPYIRGGYLRADAINGTSNCTLFLDNKITLSSSSIYKLYLYSKLGTSIGNIRSFNFTVPQDGDYDSITIDQQIIPLPLQLDSWIVAIVEGSGPDEIVYLKKYRILAISRQSENEEVTLTLEPYDESVYTDDITFNYTGISPPQNEIIASNFPADVANLTAAQAKDSYDVIVTYSMPSETVERFRSLIISIEGNVLTYEDQSGLSDNSLVTYEALYIYSGSSGSYKGKIYINKINRTDNTISFTIDKGFNGSLNEGDYVVQKSESAHLQISHVLISVSDDGQNYNIVGSDYSKGTGYIIHGLSSKKGKRIWIKAQSVAITGTMSLQPPVCSLVIGSTSCISAPTHLSLCGQNSGDTYFDTCDVCISWQPSSDFAGAGIGIETEAGTIHAGATSDYKLNGYIVWVFDNTNPSNPVLFRQVQVANTSYTYTHEQNIQDQHNTYSINGRGTRNLLFRVYQLDSDGNSSCEPAELTCSNLQPSMQGIYPVLGSNRNILFVDWSQYTNTPELFNTDVTGYTVYYGLNFHALASITIDGAFITSTNITVPESGTYYVRVAPNDCFGPGIPSEFSEITIAGIEIPHYTPSNKIKGITGSLPIDSSPAPFNSNGKYYFALPSTVDLEAYGFTRILSEDEYSQINHHMDQIYYNTAPGPDYCLVTASQLNINNTARGIWYDESIQKWMISVPIPNEGLLNQYGYTIDDGVPKAGQYVSINACAQLINNQYPDALSQEVATSILAKWHSVSPDDPELNQLASYEIRIFDASTDMEITKTYVQVNKNIDNNYDYTFEYSILPPLSRVSLSISLVSISGDLGPPIYVYGLFVCKETATLETIPINWDAVASPDGQSIQITIQNWNDLFYNLNIKHFEVYAAVGEWVDGEWQCPSDFLNIDSLPTIYPYKEEKLLWLGDPHDEQSIIVNVDSDNDSYKDSFYLGNTSGPIFEWENETCKEEGGIPCIHYQIDFGTHEPYCDLTSINNCLTMSSQHCAHERTNESGQKYCTAPNAPYGTPPCPCGKVQGNDYCLYTPETHPFGSSNCPYKTIPGNNNCRYEPAYRCDHDLGYECGRGSSYYRQGRCPYGPALYANNLGGCYYQNLNKNLSCSRWLGGKTYNVYYVALGIRTVTGQLQWAGKSYPSNTGIVQVKQARLDLLESIHIQDASITRAMIRDLAVSNAKIEKLDVKKVFVGNHDLYPDLPLATHCIHDRGTKCAANYPDYGSSPCPYGKIGSCPYQPDEFTLDKIFTYSFDPINKQITYINGGFIATGSIVADKIQVGALPYVLDLQVIRLFNPDNPTAVQIKWGKSGNLDQNASILYANRTYFEIAAGSSNTFIVPTDGENYYIAYIIIPTSQEPNICNVAFYLTTPQDPTWRTIFFNNGYIPIFTVNIINKPHSGYTVIREETADTIIESSYGQFKVEIEVLGSSFGTYIQNDDITTGVVHNSFWSSFFDMRTYTGMNTTGNYGTGRIAIDAPSCTFNKSVVSPYIGDYYGAEWWNGVFYQNKDVKLIIGRPYYEGLENYTNQSKTQCMQYGDKGYLWFYRDSQGNGHLEIGGKVSVTDVSTEPYTSLLIGYGYSGTTRIEEQAINFYDITNYINSSDNPVLLLKIADYLRFSLYNEQKTTETRRILLGMEYSTGSQSWQKSPTVSIYANPETSKDLIARFASEWDQSLLCTHYLSATDPPNNTYQFRTLTIDPSRAEISGNPGHWIDYLAAGYGFICRHMSQLVIEPNYTNPSYAGGVGLSIVSPHDIYGNTIPNLAGIGVATDARVGLAVYQRFTRYNGYSEYDYNRIGVLAQMASIDSKDTNYTRVMQALCARLTPSNPTTGIDYLIGLTVDFGLVPPPLTNWTHVYPIHIALGCIEKDGDVPTGTGIDGALIYYKNVRSGRKRLLFNIDGAWIELAARNAS